MRKIIVAAALATAIASPAFAQSYDPDLGSGNITGQRNAQALHLNLGAGAQGAYARVGDGAPVVRRSFDGNTVGTDPDQNIQFQLNRESQQGRP